MGENKNPYVRPWIVSLIIASALLSGFVSYCLTRGTPKGFGIVDEAEYLVVGIYVGPNNSTFLMLENNNIITFLRVNTEEVMVPHIEFGDMIQIKRYPPADQIVVLYP